MSYEDPFNVQDELEVPKSEMSDLKPNPRGLYTLCFHCNCRQPPLNNEDEIRELFSPVAPIAEFANFKGLQFVRFTTKELAIKAWKAFRVKLQIKVADQRRSPVGFKGPNSDEQNSIEIKKPKTNRKSPDHSTNNDSDGVMLYMGNIAMNSTEEDIQEFMSGINVLEWKILKKKNKCYAFLKVSDQKEADKAVEMFHNKSFMNRVIILRVFRTFDPEAKSATCHLKIPTAKQIDNHKKSQTSATVNHSTFPDNQNFDDLKARMPPLENIVSSDDDDESDEDIYLESPINGNTRQAHLNNVFHLFVGNFPYGTSEANLMKLFQPYHPIKAIIMNGNDKRRSTQGFVCFSNPRDLDQATMEMDRTEYKNQILLVTSSVCCGNIQKDKRLQCTITAVPGVNGISIPEEKKH